MHRRLPAARSTATYLIDTTICYFFKALANATKILGSVSFRLANLESRCGTCALAVSDCVKIDFLYAVIYLNVYTKKTFDISFYFLLSDQSPAGLFLPVLYLAFRMSC